MYRVFKLILIAAGIVCKLTLKAVLIMFMLALTGTHVCAGSNNCMYLLFVQWCRLAAVLPVCMVSVMTSVWTTSVSVSQDTQVPAVT